MYRADAASGLLSFIAVRDHSIFAQVDSQTLAFGVSLLGILDARRTPLEDNRLIRRRVLRPIACALPAGLCDNHIALGNSLFNFARFLVEIDISRPAANPIRALLDVHTALVMQQAIRVRIEHALGGRKDGHDFFRAARVLAPRLIERALHMAVALQTLILAVERELIGADKIIVLPGASSA